MGDQSGQVSMLRTVPREWDTREWDTTTRDTSITPVFHQPQVKSMAMDPQEQTLVVGGQSGQLKLWDLYYGQGVF